MHGIGVRLSFAGYQRVVNSSPAEVIFFLCVFIFIAIFIGYIESTVAW